MNLFDIQNTEKEHNISPNILPKDGITEYFGQIFSVEDTQNYFDILLKTIEWKNDEAIIYGKKIITKRKVAWYGEKNYTYAYSGVSKTANIWENELVLLKEIVEKYAQTTFNSCLLNLYHNGEEGMSWHSDDDKYLVKNGVIASLSLGAARKFVFKHKETKETIPILLENGSLLIMKDTTQKNWLHSLPKTTKISTPRINLTFRQII